MLKALGSDIISLPLSPFICLIFSFGNFDLLVLITPHIALDLLNALEILINVCNLTGLKHNVINLVKGTICELFCHWKTHNIY